MSDPNPETAAELHGPNPNEFADHVDEQVTPGDSGPGRAVTRSTPRPDKIPGANLSPESSRRLQAELQDIARAERDGRIGADNYYLGVRRQP